MNLVWSHTFLDSFETCPREAYHKYVAKDLPKEKKSKAQLDGIAIHEVFDLRLRCKMPLPEIYAKHEPMMLALEHAAIGKTLEAEKRMAINAKGEPCDFFAKDVWGRGTADVVIHGDNVAFIFDWKNGKVREDNAELNRHALLLKCHYPGIHVVTGSHGWLQENRVGRKYDLSDFAGTWSGILGTMKTVEMLPPDKEWAANPSWKCGWCAVKTCPHNKT